MQIKSTTIRLTVNGKEREVQVPSHWTLLQVLRDALGLRGTREGCGEGSCGSCTVLVDGELVRACLFLAVRAQGRSVTTVEGLASNGELSPLQKAFMDMGAVQCGFCTSGFLLTSRKLLEDYPDPSEEQIKEYLSGNFCRCGGYPMILRAVQEAAKALQETRTAKEG